MIDPTVCFFVGMSFESLASDPDEKLLLDKALTKQQEAFFKRIDTNGDGKITLEENAAALDTNKDGKITQEEFQAPALASLSSL